MNLALRKWTLLNYLMLIKPSSMFAAIKTSKNNKEIVTRLTAKLGLGAENVIARIAFANSLAQNRMMDLSGVQDSQGKEYSSRVLFGDYADIYVAMICVQYDLNKSSKDIPKYIKMHLDDGLEMIEEEFKKKSSMSGMDFVINKIEKGLKEFFY